MRYDIRPDKAENPARLRARACAKPVATMIANAIEGTMMIMVAKS